MSMMLDALSKTVDDIDPGDPYGAYTTVIGGPIFEDSHSEKLMKALRGFLTPGQCLGFLEQTKSTLTLICSGSSGGQNTPGAENSERPRKQRKLDLEPSACSPAKAIKFALVCSVIAIAWTSLPFHSLVDESRSEAVNGVRGVDMSIITPLLSAGLKRKRDEQGKSIPRSWSRDVVMSSVLRLQYVLSMCASLDYHPTHDTKMGSRMLKFLESSDVLPELKIEIVNHHPSPRNMLLLTCPLEPVISYECFIGDVQGR